MRLIFRGKGKWVLKEEADRAPAEMEAELLRPKRPRKGKQEATGMRKKY